jgi:hypothetical protein
LNAVSDDHRIVIADRGEHRLDFGIARAFPERRRTLLVGRDCTHRGGIEIASAADEDAAEEVFALSNFALRQAEVLRLGHWGSRACAPADGVPATFSAHPKRSIARNRLVDIHQCIRLRALESPLKRSSTQPVRLRTLEEENGVAKHVPQARSLSLADGAQIASDSFEFIVCAVDVLQPTNIAHCPVAAKPRLHLANCDVGNRCRARKLRNAVGEQVRIRGVQQSRPHVPCVPLARKLRMMARERARV